MTKKTATTLMNGSLAATLVLALGAALMVVASPPAPQVMSQKQCNDLMVEFKVLGAEIGELDQKLDAKVVRMDSAAESERLDAMQSVIEEMSTQRRQVLDRIKRTHQLMLVHMMDHLASEGGSASMAQCPLMGHLHYTEPRKSGMEVHQMLDR